MTEREISQWEIFRWAVENYLRPHVRKLTLAGMFIALSAAATASVAWLTKPIMDEAIHGSGDSLYPVAITLFLVMTFNGLAIYAHTSFLASVSHRIVADLQIHIFDKLMAADVAYLNKNHSGQFISRCINDTSFVGVLVTQSALSLVRDSLMFLLLAGVMLFRDWQLSLITLLVVPFVFLGISRVGRLTRTATVAQLTHAGSFVTILSEALGALRLIKASGAEEHEAKRAREAIEQRRWWSVRLARTQAVISPLTETLGGLVVALTIFYGVWRFETGEFSVGTLASFLAALALSYRPAKRLSIIHSKIQQGLVALRRIREILDVEPSIVDAEHARPLAGPPQKIEFENVSFGYTEREATIDDISFTVTAGEKVALVGPSGGGKSTLFNLIPRFYEVTSGRILFDGVDVRDLTLDSLRGSISLFTQETLLFDDSVRANIAYGRRDALEEEIRSAAKAAFADEFIEELPQGYDTIVGERGVNLSVGQRQRIAIARMMLRDFSIVLLDEPTSSLDSASERLVMLALDKLTEHRATLIASHRLSTIIDADQILVMDQGQIVEKGTHQQLLAGEGLYARLYALQSTEARGESQPPPDNQWATESA